jgi:hypothetical protein
MMNRIVVLIAVGMLTVACGGQDELGQTGQALTATVLPPGGTPYGKTYNAWGAAWWQWAVSMPMNDTPFVAATGADCSKNQSGDVWFLFGEWEDATTKQFTMNCTIPAGKAILVPVLNANCMGPEDGTTEEEIRACAYWYNHPTNRLVASVDGVPVPNLESYYEKSPVFSYTVPENNVLQFWGYERPAGTYPNMVDEGFYFMVAPPSPGQHVIAFQSQSRSYKIDMRFNITVQ